MKKRYIAPQIYSIKLDTTSNKYYNDKNSNGVLDVDEEVSVVLKTIAETKVKDLSGVINSLKIFQIFSEQELQRGMLSLIDDNTEVENFAKEMEEAIKNTTIDELIACGVIDEPANYNTLSGEETTVLKEDGQTFKKVSELTLPEMIDYCFEMIDKSNDL